MQEKYSDSFQNNKQVMDIEPKEEPPVQKKVDLILKEGVVYANEIAQVIVHIINAMDTLNKRVEELEKGKKRKID